MNEAQKICVAKREFADALYSSNVFPMWKRNNYGTATRVRVSLNKNSKQICVRASDIFLVFGEQNIKPADAYRFSRVMMKPVSEKLEVAKISGAKYSVEYIAEYVVPFVSMSSSDMSAAAYSLA